ncbi:MAG: hypothetical protein JNM93_05345 [Bacteriovoracaceae bacterium]|nr:hypothetical protein [Bacteriovoracaceae bacterium]
MSDLDLEIVALTEINKVLSPIQNEQTLERIIRWASEKFTPTLISSKIIESEVPVVHANNMNTADSSINFQKNEIPGIALVTDKGAFKLTLRDTKAKSNNDAAIRLVLVSIYAHNLLTGSSEVSTKEIINPILKHWRVYDGNTRKAIAGHQGIIRASGGMLSLDYHATEEAKSYVKEISDPSVKGTWKASAVKNKKQNNGVVNERN